MARIATRRLARLCHNLGTGLHAGLEVRRAWDNECRSVSPGAKWAYDAVREQLGQGNTVAAAFKSTNQFFPPLFCEMLEVGERTGRLEQVFIRLAEHYDQVLVLRRNFLMGIAWPMIQLVLAILVIGALIWILGAIGGGNPETTLTVFGLSGGNGALIWLGGWGCVAAAIALPIVAISKGWMSIGPLFRLFLKLPWIGGGIETIAMSRLTWALAMATDSDLPPDKAIELAVRSTQNTYYSELVEQMRLSIRRGSEMHEAMRSTSRFPDDFLDALQTGELAGRVSETLQRLSKDYDERAKLWYRGLTVAAGFSVFVFVAIVVIVLIFQVFSIYTGALNDASKM